MTINKIRTKGTTTTPDLLPFDKRFTRFDDENRAGLAVMAIQNGVTLFKKGYGLRDLESAEKVDCDTNFRMASVSKQFTAMCVAILEENRKLSVNDYIGQYLPDIPEYMKSIKISHLIHHLSGLPDYSDALWSSDKNKPLISNHDVYAFYKNQKKLDFKPGKRFEYSNGGYTLLALVIEVAAGESFKDFTERHIFTPANMKNSAIIIYPSTIRNQAVSYSDWPFFENIDYNTGNVLHGEDGVYTSLNDMQHWIEAIESNSLVSATMTKKLFSAVKTNSGKKVRYGYGWELGKFRNHKVVYHGGSWVGFNTNIINVPKKKLWIVGFSNSYAIDSENACREILEHYLDIKPDNS